MVVAASSNAEASLKSKDTPTPLNYDRPYLGAKRISQDAQDGFRRCKNIFITAPIACSLAYVVVMGIGQFKMNS